MKTLTYILLATTILALVIMPSRAGTDTSQDLTKQLTSVWFEIQKIKPGMTRADLVKIFKENTGGVAWPESKPFPFMEHQKYDYRGCQIIQVDVDFAPSDSKAARPTDIITKISKPYLDASPRN
jgi:hypothetical protein